MSQAGELGRMTYGPPTDAFRIDLKTRVVYVRVGDSFRMMSDDGVLAVVDHDPGDEDRS